MNVINLTVAASSLLAPKELYRRCQVGDCFILIQLDFNTIQSDNDDMIRQCQYNQIGIMIVIAVAAQVVQCLRLDDRVLIVNLEGVRRIDMQPAHRQS